MAGSLPVCCILHYAKPRLVGVFNTSGKRAAYYNL